MGKPKAAIIGSGFGGSVTGCRLAESGRYEVHILERGPRYGRNEFPRRPDQLREAFWDPDDGFFGLFEYSSFSRSQVDVLTASGLGGGSLIYSNVLYPMPECFFRTWPGGITRASLDPYYDRVLRTMEATPYPVYAPDSPYRDTPKTLALAEAAAKIRSAREAHPAARLELPPLAIQFSNSPGEERINAQGVKQTTCVMCGECNTGCNTHAKNTLDLNYLALAERRAARIRTWCEVSEIRPAAGGGYDLTLGDPRTRETSTERFDIVVVAAGSLGSPRLMLQMRDHGHLPKLSQTPLGTRWSPNGDLLAFILDTAGQVLPTRGPVITAAIRMDQGHYPDGFPAALWIEDGGFPGFLAWFILGRIAPPSLEMLRTVYHYIMGLIGKRSESNIGDDLSPLVADARLTKCTLPLLGMGRDRSTGVMELDPQRARRRDSLRLRWDVGASELHYERMRSGMERIAAALGGQFLENPLSGLNRYVTVHPVGGCPMSDNDKTGVVDARTGQVFQYPGLYIVDGSIIPTAVGPNPSLTIAALAEMYAERLCQ
ncbi:MAG: GMC family oxidoreductase [Acidobacteriota bacterium]